MDLKTCVNASVLNTEARNAISIGFHWKKVAWTRVAETHMAVA